MFVLPIFCLFLGLHGCGGGTMEVVYDGSVECAHCKMNILDNRFGAALKTGKGRDYFFDGIECLVPFVHQSAEMKGQMAARLLVTDFNKPGTLIEAPQAYFMHSPALQSPMAGNVAAFSSEADLKTAQAAYAQSSVWTWTQVQDSFKNLP
jgi:copper chaperone NosL